MPDFNYVNPKINNIDKQEISIQISLSGFSFIIRDSETQLCLLFRHYAFNNLLLIDQLIRKVEEIVSQESVFRNSYVQSNLIYISQKATLVPEDFFDTSHLKKYFEFSHPLDELDELHFNVVNTIKAYNVFSVPNYLSGVFYPLLPNIKFYHQATKLIDFGMTTGDAEKYKAVVGLNSTFFDIELYEDNQLLLSNSFQYSNSMDFIYFYMYTCRQLKIETTDMIVYFLGHSLKKNEIVHELNKLVKRIVYPNFTKNLHCRSLNNTDMLKFYNLFLPFNL